MPSSILRRVPGLAAAGAALALTAAAPALAIPADQAPVAPHATAAGPAVPQFRTTYQPAAPSTLTPAQLRAIDGHQPPDPPAASQTPAAVSLKPASPSSSGIPAWLIVLIAGGTAVAGLAALGGTRVATHRTVVPRRRQRVGV